MPFSDSWWYMWYFLWSSGLKLQWLGCLSCELPQIKTAKRGISDASLLSLQMWSSRFKVFQKVSLKWKLPYLSRLHFARSGLLAVQNVGALAWHNWILNEFPGAVALKTWKMYFYGRCCGKILTGLEASDWELKTRPKSRHVDKTHYLRVNIRSLDVGNFSRSPTVDTYTFF